MAKTEVHGTIPHDEVASGSFPVNVGGIAATSAPSAVSAGDAVRAYIDEYGQFHFVLSAGTATTTVGATADAGPSWPILYTYTTSADMQTAAALTAAPTSGLKLVVTDIIFSTDTAMNFSFQEETSATVVAKAYCAANTTIQLTPRIPIRLPTADKKLFGDASAAGNVAVTVCYYSST